MGLMQLLRAVDIFTAGIAAGAQLFVLLTTIPARKHWSAKVAAQVHRTALTHPAEGYLRPTNLVLHHADSDGLLLRVRSVNITVAEH
jgi:hypothetical protein